MRQRLNILFFILLVFTHCKTKENSNSDSNYSSGIDNRTLPIKVDTFSILSSNKLDLTRKYSNRYYGINDYELKDPKIIVIHYTVIPDLEQTLRYFKGDTLESARKNIYQKSLLNVGIHYVIDKNGLIYNLLPDSVMARHLVGFNHVSLGIENIAKDSTDLTKPQLNSNVLLIKHLLESHPSLEYMIGHNEYHLDSLPHYKYMKSSDSTYLPYKKYDPGFVFMNKIRERLKADYDIILKK